LYKVIIIDDEKICRDFLEKYITKELKNFFVVSVFDSAEVAFEFVKRNHVDVIITDIRMPNFSGIELIDKVSKLSNEIHFIILSGYSEFEYAQKALEYNVERYLLKPINLLEFHKVMELLREKLDLSYERKLIENRDNAIITNFFRDLINGAFDDEDEIETEFKKLVIPTFNFDSGGCIYDVVINDFDKYILKRWKYDRSNIFVSFSNVFKTYLNATLVCTINDEEDKFIFVCFFGDNCEKNKDDNISEVFFDVLKMNFFVKRKIYFNSISKIPLLTEGVLDNKKISYELMESTLNKILKSDDDVIRKAIEYIDKNYMSDLTRDDVSKIVHLESTYFSKYFKRVLKITFADYVTYVRIKKAIEFLKKDFSLTKVSSLVGYSNSRYFCRRFKQYTGYSPLDYKEEFLK